MATERDLLYRAKFVDDVTGGVSSMSRAWQNELNAMTGSLQDNILKLKAQKEILTDPVYRQSAKQAAELRQEIKKLTDEIQPGKVQSFSESWASLASKYYLVSQAAGYASRAIGSVVDAASKYELLHARLNAVEGSAALGNRDFADVQQLAKKPGLGFEEAASTFATLRGMKVTAAEAKTLINGIAQANASAAGTAEQFGRVMYQIQQSVSLGRLMAEDLRPIQQAIPTLGAAMQQHFGSNQAEQLNKILEESGKSVREFWLEVAELGSKLPSTGETIANNIDNMGDAWVRFRAALANSDAIKGATRAMTGLLEKVAEFLEKDQAVERSYIVRTKVITQTQQAEQAKYGGAPPAYPAGLLHGDSTLTAGIMAQSLVYKASADSLAALNAKPAASIWQEVANKTKAQIDAEAATREAKDKADQDAAKKRQKSSAAADAARKAVEDEQKRLDAHRRASMANVEFTGPNEVTMRGEGGPDAEHIRNVQGAERSREAREKKDLEDAQKMRANAQKIRMDWESALIEKKRQAHDEEMKLIRERFDVGQKLASDQVYKMLQGEFTLRGAYEATKDVLFRAFADTTTKWIEEQLLKLVFAKTAQAEETAASVAQASIVGAAWAGPSMAVSIATMGGAPATGSAAWFTSMTAAQGYSMMPHARGGAVFGPYMGSREERLEPFVPSRVVPAYNSQTTNHNTTNAQQVTIHVHGGDERTILRTLRKAGINGAGVSRS